MSLQEFKTYQVMRAYEYSVTPEASAQDGMVSIASLSGYIVNAAHRTMIEEGYDDCLLSRCGFEIDERPHTGETITITVNSGLNNIVTLLNRTVLIIDSEGNEIGRGRIEWMMPRSQQRSVRAENPSHLTRRYINRFHEILPDIGYSTGLQIRIDMDFKGNAKAQDNFSVALKKICDSRYFFLARSGGDTLCRAMLQTA